MVGLSTCVMLAQSTPILYHTEANGCIFFTACVAELRTPTNCIGKPSIHNLVSYTVKLRMWKLKMESVVTIIFCT